MTLQIEGWISAFLRAQLQQETREAQEEEVTPCGARWSKEKLWTCGSWRKERVSDDEGLPNRIGNKGDRTLHSEEKRDDERQPFVLNHTSDLFEATPLLEQSLER